MSDVDGTDLSKVTADTMRAAVAPLVAERGRFVLSRVAAAVLAVALPLLGAVAGFVTGRVTGSHDIDGVVIEAGSGSGSAAVAVPAASGSAATPEVRTVPYDAKSVAAEAAVGPLSGTGEPAHLAHPADAATAAEADAK
jgi:hypothetical protein